MKKKNKFTYKFKEKGKQMRSGNCEGCVAIELERRGKSYPHVYIIVQV